MGNVYYGDGGISTVTGNWNTVANWFSTLGVCCSCSGDSPGTPLGRVPNPATDTVILTQSRTGAFIDMTTGPTGGYSGPIKATTNSGTVFGNTRFTIAAGSFSGAFDWSAFATAAETGQTIMGQLNISGGNFSGSFSGPAVLQRPVLIANAAINITGGTYAPAANATLSGNVVNYPSSTLISDPGFEFGGGTYAPVITITNPPDILGAGLPA